MTNRFETTFAGLTLSNPIIASSCSITGSVKSNQMLAEAGFSAIVLKSLFEEDIVRENEAMAESTMHHTEAADYMQAYLHSHALSNYTTLIKESKAVCGSTKIIASINCHTMGEWTKYAVAMEEAGADALELNVMSIESDLMAEDGALERKHIAIAQAVTEAVKIPVIFKLGAVMSNHVSIVSRLKACGVQGFVMFNRLYQTDIDIDTMSYTRGAVLGSAEDLATPLRYVAITSAAVPTASLAISGGVVDGEAIIKSLLAGASAVEVCSVMYNEGKNIKTWVDCALKRIEMWQEAQGYNSVDEHIGAMNNSCDEHKDEVMRAQFLKHFGSYR